MIFGFTVSIWGVVLICAAYFMAGIIDSVCGGGGLITIPALMTAGMPVGYITGTNQCAAILGGIVSTGSYARAKRIDYRAGLAVIPFSIIGGIIGAQLNLLISERFMQWLMLGTTPCIAALILAKKDIGHENRIDMMSNLRVALIAAVIGLVVGTYQGFYGPGAGALFFLALAVFEKLDILSASGTARLVGTFACFSATFSYAFSGHIFWKIAFVAAVFNIAGNYLGAKLALTKGRKVIRPMLLGVLVILMIKLLSDLFF